LAAAIKNKLHADTELIKGGKGVFKVWQDDRLLFSKKDVGRFPKHEEIFEKVSAGPSS
jgi:selT/selW/selH-like putative selenoprotein